jgi:hypothetical protein
MESIAGLPSNLQTPLETKGIEIADVTTPDVNHCPDGRG